VVHIEEKGSLLEVRVRDEGVGLAPHELEKVFEPFYKSDRHDVGIKGSGLGLAIVKKWILAHRGNVWAESPGLGHGTTFFFTLPL
jgi:two-component system, OmpR family, sensor histidine kinase VicK